ncbi:hypothetical protein BG015_005882 [Linnemannia schmuckeri]|uniref:Uncharacterized protein n=1 Tax=Linnemannia schmuckeri TaxID=64567 RepID=A0A9P5VC45_9FUNG|nr:hypothetical protein BG015_005882 [Linnemannia schmuckeri]
MLASENLPRNKILVVGRRGVGKLSLVQAILGSRFVPTTSASKSRPSSPLILPAIPVPTIEETILDDPQQQQLHGLSTLSSLTPPNTAHPDNNSNNAHISHHPSLFSPVSSTHQQQQQLQSPFATQASPVQLHNSQQGGQVEEETMDEAQMNTTMTTRSKVDHSGVTIPWTIDTKYYSVEVDFWIDETEAHGSAELERMIESGDLDEMGAVVEAVVFCFSKNQPSTFHDIKPWLAFVERHEPSITLCVATDAPMDQENAQESRLESDVVEDFDDWCLANGFEFIDLQDQPMNSNLDEHVGLDRILEALAAHMWDGLKRKSSKKRDLHERSMMMSFQDDDTDMLGDGSWRDQGARMSLNGQDMGDLSQLHDDEDYDDDDEDDEDDDRAFYKALAELNLRNRSSSPSAPGNGSFSQQLTDTSVGTTTTDGGNMTGEGFDDEFGSTGGSQSMKELDGDDLEFWSSQDSFSTSSVLGSQNPIEQALERQFRQFLGQPADGGNLSRTTNSSIGTGGGKESSYEFSSDRDISFELDGSNDFEFGNFVSAQSSGADTVDDFELHYSANGMSTPNQESIRSMHKALFSNIDDDDGMAQTIATIQGLRALPCREFGRLLQTNRYIHQTLDTHWVWHQRFVIRLGQALLAAKLKQSVENDSSSSSNVAPTPTPVGGEGLEEVPRSNLRMTSSATKQQLIDWYRHYARTTIPARDMVIIHMNNNNNWSMEKNATSQFGEVARLRYVFWLDVSAVFHGVMPGRYLVQWKLTVNSISAVENTLFRAIPAWDNTHANTIGFTPTTESSFVKATNSNTRDRFQPGPFLLQLPDQLEVGPEHPTVFVQFKNHDNFRSKSAMMIDFVRLVSIDDPTKAFIPAPVDPQWEAREQAENVDQVRREFVPHQAGGGGVFTTFAEWVTGGTAGTPAWVAPTQWANFLWGPTWQEGNANGGEDDDDIVQDDDSEEEEEEEQAQVDEDEDDEL